MVFQCTNALMKARSIAAVAVSTTDAVTVHSGEVGHLGDGRAMAFANEWEEAQSPLGYEFSRAICGRRQQ